MKTNIDEIFSLVKRQITSFFPLEKWEEDIIFSKIPTVLLSVEKCFSQINNKYFNKDGKINFNPYHSGQWLIFLYFLSHNISSDTLLTNKLGTGKQIADKIYFLNKILNAVDIYHEVALPSVFFLEHPVGTVLGRAKYNDGFFCNQGCSVGGTIDSNGLIHYPVIGYDVKMFANSAILGKCSIGNNVKLGAGTIVKNQNVPANSLVFGHSPNLIIKNV